MTESDLHEHSQPSDDKMRARIKLAIEASHYAAVRSLTYIVEQGVVKIRGQIPSFYMCQLAIESVRRVPGVVQIINQTEIVYNSVPRARDEHDIEARSRLRSSAPPTAGITPE